MGSNRFEVKGLSELDQMLKTLPVKIEKNVVRGALRAGQKIMLQGAQRQLSEVTKQDSGALENSLKIRIARRNERFGWVRSFLIAGDEHAYYSHMIEFGTASFYTGKGNSVGSSYLIKPNVKKSLFFGGKAKEAVVHPGIKPKPFMRQSVDLYSEASLNAIVGYMEKRIPKELKKAGI
jgi:HK97 gp10 family phage protein